MATPNIITISDAAAEQIKALMAQTDKDVVGLRVGVKTRGCSGLQYFIDYASKAEEGDELIEDKGIKLFIEPTSIMYMLGAEMDFVQNDLEEGFVFNNPNEKGRCGCGESFHA